MKMAMSMPMRAEECYMVFANSFVGPTRLELSGEAHFYSRARVCIQR